MVTASELDNLVTPLWKIKEGGAVNSYLNRKLAEWFLQSPLESFNAFAVEQGQVLEGEAKPAYTFETGESIQNVALITNDDGTIGCSPDGLLGDDGGIEIKCPQPEKHVEYLLGGCVPKDYLAQVHGSMFITGRKFWRFMSYRRKFPPLIVTVQRDDQIQSTIAKAVGMFLEQFQAGKARLLELNGGERPPKPATITNTPKFTWEQTGEITP